MPSAKQTSSRRASDPIGRSARLVTLCALVAIAGLLGPGAAGRANAQATSFTAAKKLCLGDPAGNPPQGCVNQPMVQAGQSVFYAVTVTSLTGAAQTISLSDPYPAGFLPGAVICKDATGATVALSNTSQPIGSYTLAAGATVTCVVQGTFQQNATNNIAAQTNTVTVSNGPESTSPAVTTAINPITKLNNDLAVTKTVSPASVGDGTAFPLPATVTYTVTVHNTGPDIDIGHWFALHDSLALRPNGVPLNGTLVSGTATCAVVPATDDCLDPAGPTATTRPPMVPTMAWDPTLDWSFAPASLGHLSSGSTMTLTYQVLIDKVASINCVNQLNADGLNNRAFFTLTNDVDHSALTENAPANNYSDGSPGGLAASSVAVNTGATFVDPNCGAVGQLTVTKKQITPSATTVVDWPPAAGTGTGEVTYQITIKNTSSPHQTITIPANGIEDDVIEGLGTPPFTRTYVLAAPIPGIASAPHHYTFYLEGNQAWKSSAPLTLTYGQTASMNIRLKYSDPDCDTVPVVNPKPIFNEVKVSYTATPVGGTGSASFVQAAFAQTNMKPQSACHFVVTKRLVSGGPRVTFGGGTPLIYKVDYTNNDAPRTIGTILDAVRISDPAYATHVPFSFTYNCAMSGTTYTATSPPTNGDAVNTSSPAQGAPVMQLTNVFFPHGATLSCTFTVVVHQPAFNDPHCSTATAFWENLGLMDVTSPYNDNAPWPPSGGYVSGNASNPSPQDKNWASVRTPLPKCYNAIVNKAASVNGTAPAWTGASGPPVNYTIAVTNTGTGTSPLTGTGNFDGLVVSDTVQAPYSGNVVSAGNVSPAALECVPSGWCTPLSPALPTSTQPQRAGVANLGVSSTANWNLTLNGPFTPNTVINNCAQLSPSGAFTQGGWYSNYDPRLPPKSCVQVPVLKTGPLTIIKTVVNQTGVAISPVQFNFAVSCSPWHLPANTGVSVTTNSSATGSVGNVPISSTPTPEACLVTEAAPAIPAAAMRACGGTAYWDTPLFSGANVTPVSGGANVSTANGPATVSVSNTLRCKSGSLSVIKKIVSDSPIPPPVEPFLVDVTCTPGGPNTTVTLNAANGYQQTLNGIPVVSACAINEQAPGITSALLRRGCSWSTDYPDGKETTVANGLGRQLTVVNHWSCKTGGGSITVLKSIVNDSPIPPPVTTFVVDVSCQPSGPNTAVTLTGANGYLQTVSNIPAGSSCTVTEQPPAVPADYARRGCHWDTEYPDGQRIPVGNGEGIKVPVVNHWSCKGGTGSVTIIKRIVNDSPIPPPVEPFVVNVNCLSSGPNTTVTLTSADGYQQTVSNIPAGSSCTVTEQAPAGMLETVCW